MTETKAQWIIRPSEPGDISYIYATWLRSYRTGNGLGLSSGKHTYFTLYQLIIDFILQKESTKCWVAALKDEPAVVIGYMVVEPKALHYCFVKEAFRRFGVATALYKHCFDKPPAITHMTKQGLSIIGDLQAFKLKPELIFKGD